MNTTTTPTNTLTSLTSDRGRISPPFSPARTGYVLFVGQDDETVTITAKAQEGAAVSMPAQPMAIGRGCTEIVITVGGEKQYKVGVRRPYPTPTWRLISGTRGVPAPPGVPVVPLAPGLPGGNLWPARDSAGELVFQDHMWLFGGYTPKVINDVWRSCDGVSWERMPDFPTEAGVNIPIRFVFNDQMWITDNAGAFFRSSDGKTWTQIANPIPWTGRHTAGSAVFKGRMWVVGGIQGERRNDAWSSDNGVDWRLETEHAPWCPRQLHDNLVVHDGQLYVIGGGIQQYHPFIAYNDVWRSPDGRNWQRMTEQAPWAARNWASCVSYRGRLWMFAGYRAEPKFENFDDVWYSTDGAEWQRLITPDIWSPRHEVSPYVFRDALWLVAGNSWPLASDVWQLRFDGLTFISQPVIEDFAGSLYRYHAHADFHASRSPVRYRLIESPPWLAIDPQSGAIKGTIPAEGVSGVPGAQEVKVTVEAFTSVGETVRQSYTLHIRK